jgi:hypothetical protein
MKKLIFTILAIAIAAFTFAQTPQAFKYQAVARNIGGEAIQDQNVRLRISIQQGASYANQYVETQLATTNSFGLFTIEIGNGTIMSGNFSAIDWSLGEYYIKIEMDETGGTNYELMGTTPLLSVPFAMHAKTAESISGILPETDPVFSMSDAKTITSADINDWNNKLTTEVDGSTTNEIQDISLSGTNLTISSGSTIDLSSIAGTDTDDQTLSLSGTVLTITDGNSVNLGLIDTDTQLSEAEVDAFVSNNGFITSELDASTTNEIQSLSLTGKNLSISSGNTVDLSSIDTDTKLSEVEVDSYVSNNGYLTTFTEVDASTTNEIQSLSLSGTNLSISSGNTVSLSSIDTDDQTLVEILTASPNAGYKRISQVNTPSDDWDVANKIYVDTRTLGGILTNDNSAGNNRITFVGTPIAIEDAATKGYVDGKIPSAQTLSLSGSTLYISSGNSVDLSSLGGGVDTDDQTLSLSGTTLSIADGNSVDLSSIDTKLNETQVDAYVSNNGYLTSFTEVDASTTNEIQDISLSGTSISISSGSTINLSSIITDDQTLSEVLTSGTDAGNKNIVNVAQAGIGTATPNASAALEISSTTKGFLPPRMTEAQMLALTAVEGLTVYNTTRKVLVFHNGSEWRNYDNTPYLYVGKSYQGGVIAYIFVNGDAGYVADEIHGIIAATADQSASAIWGCNTISVGTNSGLGQGQTSTTNIVAACSTSGIAAKICNDLVVSSYSDWFLPSKDELYKLYSNRTSIGGFTTGGYWTSTQYSTSNGYYYSFSTGVSYNTNKENFQAVRAIRNF